MLPAIAITAIIAFALGWVFKDYKWTKAAKTGKVMVVDGDLYDVTKHRDLKEDL